MGGGVRVKIFRSQELELKPNRLVGDLRIAYRLWVGPRLSVECV